MAKYRTLYCSYCEQERLFRKPRVNHLQNLALTIITAGLYLIPWAALTFHRLRSPWRCRTCHHSFRRPEKAPVPETSVPATPRHQEAEVAAG